MNPGTYFKSGGGNLPDAPELLDRLGAKGIDIDKWKKDYPEDPRAKKSKKLEPTPPTPVDQY